MEYKTITYDGCGVPIDTEINWLARAGWTLHSVTTTRGKFGSKNIQTAVMQREYDISTKDEQFLIEELARTNEYRKKLFIELKKKEEDALQRFFARFSS